MCARAFSPPAVQCESQVPPGLLEAVELARPGGDPGDHVDELEMSIGELGGDQVGDAVEFARHHPVRYSDKARAV